MPKFTIYKTDSPDDVAAFLALFEPNGEPSIHPRLVIDENEWDLWLAEANGELVGGALCCEMVDEAGDGWGGEDNLIVGAPFRRQGLARQLMAVVESY
jgi:GNAT superfamily N-acetyltransferase